MEILIALCVGVSLAAACGFRVFVPLLVMAVGVHTGAIPPGNGFEWVGTRPALVALSVATLVEIAVYYIPWLDHAMDTITSPAAILAGVMAMAAVLPDMPEWLRWASAVIAGGGAAGIVQGGTVATRALSAATTGGLGNVKVAKFELIGSSLLSILGILLPIVAAIVVVMIIAVIVTKMAQWKRRRGESTGVEHGGA